MRLRQTIRRMRETVQRNKQIARSPECKWLDICIPGSCGFGKDFTETDGSCRMDIRMSLTSFPSAFPLTLGIRTFMMRPLSLAVGVSMPISDRVSLMISLIPASSIIFGAYCSRTARRRLHSLMISVRSGGVISRVSFVCLISFKMT